MSCCFCFLLQRTLTIQQTVQQNLQPLILRLRTTMHGNEGVLVEEQTLMEQMNRFKAEINRHIDELNQCVQLYKAKETNGLNRAENREAYKSILIFVIYIIDELNDLIKVIFNRYRLFINDIWQALQRNEDIVETIRYEFEGDINRILQRWEQYFKAAEEKLKSVPM
jgi:hypothetical protein